VLGSHQPLLQAHKCMQGLVSCCTLVLTHLMSVAAALLALSASVLWSVCVICLAGVSHSAAGAPCHAEEW
jgi:hypothetical protein